MNKKWYIAVIVLSVAALGYMGIGYYHSNKDSFVQVKNDSQQTTPINTADAVRACNLNINEFINKVNDLRASVGLSSLIHSPASETAANRRIADMVQYEFYGHKNPVTGSTAATFLSPEDPNADFESEVLDGPNTSSDAYMRFVKSPEHYAILTSGKVNNIGVAYAYHPNTFKDYDDDGHLQDGSFGSSCIVDAVLGHDR